MTLHQIGKSDLTWDIAQLYPTQGNWSVEEYLNLDTNHLIEFNHGRLEFLPMPTKRHQDIAAYLYILIRRFFLKNAMDGQYVLAPFPIYLWEGKYREPDVAVMLGENEWRCEDTFWRGADIVFEVVSPSNAKHDTETKRREYAEAEIPEYWLIDQRTQIVTVLRLNEKRYDIAGAYSDNQSAASIVLNGFQVDVADLFAQAS